MVAALTQGRPKYADHAELCDAAVPPRGRSRTSCFDLADEDAAAYAACAIALEAPARGVRRQGVPGQPDQGDGAGRRRGAAALRRALPRGAGPRRGARRPLQHERLVGPAGRRRCSREAAGRRRRRERPRQPAAHRRRTTGPTPRARESQQLLDEIARTVAHAVARGRRAAARRARPARGGACRGRRA